MKNFIMNDDTITVPAPYAVTSGQGCMCGALFGIASTDASIGNSVELATEGVYDITALSTDVASGTAFALAYWDDTNKRVTVTASTNLKIGVIVAAKASGATTARVRLNGAF
jgi:predicted RecA/RadA family phage recombinase